MIEKHLWEIEHPGYCEQGNPDPSYSDEESHLVFSDWQDFRANYADTPEVENSANLVYRWDWKIPDNDDVYPEGTRPPDSLFLYIVNQRRGPFIFSVEVPVTPDDETGVKEWLSERAEAMRSVWTPLLNEALDNS